MTSQPRAFFAVDLGAATTAAAIVGRPAGRWRLLAAAAMPTAVPLDAVLELLVSKLETADRELLAALDGTEGLASRHLVDEWPRLIARSSPPARIAVLAASRRQAALLERAAILAGWQVVRRSLDEDDGLSLTRAALDGGVTAMLVGSGDPPGGDERGNFAELVAAAAAAAGRRPEMKVVLAGGMAREAHRFGRDVAEVSDAADAAAGGDETGSYRAFIAPDATSGSPAGAPLRAMLEGLRMERDDARRAAVTATASLARVLGRRIELVEIGIDGGLRCQAWPTGEGQSRVETRWATFAAAALVPRDVDDAILDGVRSWSTTSTDRYRLADRLREVRANPWGEIEGDGALLRLAAGRAALERLVDATDGFFDAPAPDLLIAAGGAWIPVPPPVVALALADIVRRPGASQLALDHARLLGPLGAIADDEERERLLLDLRDDLLLPLGSVVVPQGLRSGHSAGRLVVHADAGVTELDLVPGGLELVDLPPGQAAVAELDFRDMVFLGARGRHFATQVTGGLGGLLVDLRDVPLRLPERPERRRELLDAWQSALWTDLGR